MGASRRVFEASILALVLLGAASAWAGSAVHRTGLVWVGNSQTYGCPILNNSTKIATNVIGRIRDASGVVHCASSCVELAPFDACVNNCTSGTSPGFVYCEVTSDQGSKSLRGTLVNVTTGASSEAR